MYERILFLKGAKHRLSKILKDPYLRQALLEEKTVDFLRFVPDPTPEETEEVVSRDGISIKYVDNPSDDLKLIAVAEEPYAILYIEDRTFELSKMALGQNPELIKLLDDPTDEEIEYVWNTSRKQIVSLNFERVAV